jgi:hypothetical protein
MNKDNKDNKDNNNNMLIPMIILILSFIFLLSYYIIEKPKYVLDKNNNNVFSIRLSLIYSLLFSNALSLFFIAVNIIIKQYFK